MKFKLSFIGAAVLIPIKFVKLCSCNKTVLDKSFYVEK